MIGYNYFSEATTKEKHSVEIIAETDGIVAIYPFGDLKIEARKFPRAIFRVMEIAANKTLENLHYNVYSR